MATVLGSDNLVQVIDTLSPSVVEHRCVDVGRDIQVDPIATRKRPSLVQEMRSAFLTFLKFAVPMGGAVWQCPSWRRGGWFGAPKLANSD